MIIIIFISLLSYAEKFTPSVSKEECIEAYKSEHKTIGSQLINSVSKILPFDSVKKLGEQPSFYMPLENHPQVNLLELILNNGLLNAYKKRTDVGLLKRDTPQYRKDHGPILLFESLIPKAMPQEDASTFMTETTKIESVQTIINNLLDKGKICKKNEEGIKVLHPNQINNIVLAAIKKSQSQETDKIEDMKLTYILPGSSLTVSTYNGVKGSVSDEDFSVSGSDSKTGQL